MNTKASCDRASGVRAQLVHMGMDTPVSRRELQIRLQERAIGFVDLTRFHNKLCQWVFAGLEKRFGKAWQVGLGARVLNALPVKGNGDTRRGPDVHAHAYALLDLGHDLLLTVLHLVNEP